MEGSKLSGVKHLVYASTSSTYGLNTTMPLIEKMPTEHPMTYAATKKANEMFAHSYSHLLIYQHLALDFLLCTVHGEDQIWLYFFCRSPRKGEKINVFNHGNMIRDFTYVDDIVESIVRLVVKPPTKNPNWNSDIPRIDSSSAPYRIFNIGNGSPVKLMDYIKALEESLNIKGEYNMMDIQPGDVPATHADTSALENYINFKPNTPTREGVRLFADWYNQYYK